MPAYERIASLAPSNTEILYALGVGDRVVATTSLCDHPAAAEETPSVGGWTNPDIDAVAEHDPDLVLAADALQDEAVAACREAGMFVKQLRPTRFHDVFNTVKAVGELVGAQDAARELVEELNDRVRDTAGVLDEEHIYCEEWQSPAMVSGNWVPDIITLLGGEYPVTGGTRSREVSVDEIHGFNPEHIVLHPCGAGDQVDASQVLEREGWGDVAAVQEEQVHVVDDALLNRPGPRLVDGMERLADLLT